MRPFHCVVHWLTLKVDDIHWNELDWNLKSTRELKLNESNEAYQQWKTITSIERSVYCISVLSFEIRWNYKFFCKVFRWYVLRKRNGFEGGTLIQLPVKWCSFFFYLPNSIRLQWLIEYNRHFFPFDLSFGYKRHRNTIIK